MPILFDESLDKQLDANGTEGVAQQDASFFQGIGKGLATGLESAGVTMQRLGAGYASAQQQAQAGQMLAASSMLQDEKTKATLKNAAENLQRDDTLRDEKNLPQYPVFNPEEIGAVGIGLGKFVQQTPTLAAAIINPIAGAAVGYTQGQTEAHAEGYKTGLRGEALETYSQVGGVSGAVGGGMPGVGGIGESIALKYGSRFVIGGALNLGQEAIDVNTRASILEANGFTAQAAQMRQMDAESMAASFALGGVFNLAGGGHRDARVRSEDIDAATGHVIHDNYINESAPGIAGTVEAQNAHVDAMNSTFKAINEGKPVDVSAHINETHDFVVPRDFAETQAHMQNVIDGDPEFHAGLKELRDAVEAEGGDAQTPRQALADGELVSPTPEAQAQRAKDDAAVNAGTTEAQRPNEGAPPATPAEPLNEIQVARQRADAIAQRSPEAAAALHAELDAIEHEHAMADLEADAYSVAAACAISHGI